jgi:hypothetical protein
MQEDVLIHQTSDQKVCNIEKHYELATIEFNSMKITSVAVEKISSLAKEDVSKLKENLSIVTKEDASIEEKMNTKQKKNASILKKSDTDLVLTAVIVASDEEISMNQISSDPD